MLIPNNCCQATIASSAIALDGDVHCVRPTPVVVSQLVTHPVSWAQRLETTRQWGFVEIYICWSIIWASQIFGWWDGEMRLSKKKKIALTCFEWVHGLWNRSSCFRTNSSQIRSSTSVPATFKGDEGAQTSLLDGTLVARNCTWHECLPKLYLVRTIAPYIAINMFHERKWVLYYRTHPTTRQPSAPQRWKPIRSVGWAWCETAKQLNKNGPQTTVPCTIGKWLKVWRTRSCTIIKSGELKKMMKHTWKHEVGYRNKNE